MSEPTQRIIPMTHQPKRHPGNSNLHLHHGNTFQGLPVMMSHVPFITEYLERFHETTQLGLSAHRRVFAVRFDLRFPGDDLTRIRQHCHLQICRFPNCQNPISKGTLQATEWLCTSGIGALVLGQGDWARRSSALPFRLAS